MVIRFKCVVLFTILTGLLEFELWRFGLNPFESTAQSNELLTIRGICVCVCYFSITLRKLINIIVFHLFILKERKNTMSSNEPQNRE